MPLFVRQRRYLLALIPLAAVVFATGATGATAPATTRSELTRPFRSAPDATQLHADLSARRLVIVQNGQVIREFPVAIGLPSHPTPTGQFTIRRMIWNPGWVPPKNRAWAKGKQAREPGDPRSPMQAVKIFFREPHYYIHGTNDPKSIGGAASRGCLRMTPEDAAELGAYLMERGGQPREESWFRRVFRFGRSTVIYLDNPIPLTITR
jgi:lipoprotein-anchoring transpeptidase ErfK/SrfK